MLIEKHFWLKETPVTKYAFSYDNKSNVTKFVAQYGGTHLKSLQLSDDVASHIQPNMDVYSVLVNTYPDKPKLGEGAANPRRFKLLVREGKDKFYFYGEAFETLREANTAAKNMSKYFDVIVVVKERFTDEAIDETLIPQAFV